jgi:hemoglobin
MRARHLPFEIDEAARQVWLGCFEKTLKNAGEKYNFPAQHLEGFKIFLRDFSAWMVNKQ